MEIGNPAEIVDLIRDGGALLLLVVAILGGIRGWYVWKREFDDERSDKLAAIKERDEWKALAIELMRATDRATSLAERVVGK
jgi:hypothetical protein